MMLYREVFRGENMKKFKILLLIVSILLVSGCGTTKESITAEYE